MWGENSDQNGRRPSPGNDIVGGLQAVPKWVWIAFAVVFLVGLTIATRGVPIFLLGFILFFGWNRFGRHGRSEPRHGGHRARQRHGARPVAPTIRWGEPAGAARATEEPADVELRDALRRGRDLANRMRRSLGGIRDGQIRTRATHLVDDADRILASLRDRGDRTLAATFNERYLTPAETILSRYTRLQALDLTTGRDALDRVESHDLPLLQKRYDEFYEQVHRGDLIDLEVASEMLAFELGTPYHGTPSLSDQPSGPDDDPLPEREPVRWRTDETRRGA